MRWKEIIIIKKLLSVENDKRGYFGTTNNHKDKNKILNWYTYNNYSKIFNKESDKEQTESFSASLLM